MLTCRSTRCCGQRSLGTAAVLPLSDRDGRGLKGNGAERCFRMSLAPAVEVLAVDGVNGH